VGTANPAFQVHPPGREAEPLDGPNDVRAVLVRHALSMRWWTGETPYSSPCSSFALGHRPAVL